MRVSYDSTAVHLVSGQRSCRVSIESQPLTTIYLQGLEYKSNVNDEPPR